LTVIYLNPPYACPLPDSLHCNLPPAHPPTPPPQGFDIAKKALLEHLEGFKTPCDPSDREMLLCVARTSLRTKLHQALADQLTSIVTDAVLTIRQPGTPLDLYMVREVERGGEGKGGWGTPWTYVYMYLCIVLPVHHFEQQRRGGRRDPHMVKHPQGNWEQGARGASPTQPNPTQPNPSQFNST
jgi:hypothetical protein